VEERREKDVEGELIREKVYNGGKAYDNFGAQSYWKRESVIHKKSLSERGRR